jgi:hypothetical protein
VSIEERIMNLWLREEDCRPRIYWFEDENGNDVGECFFMGDINVRTKMAEDFGNVVVNKGEF